MVVKLYMLLVRLIMHTGLNMSFFDIQSRINETLMYDSIESKIEFATDPKCCFIFESRYTVYIYTQTYIFRYIYIDGYTYKYCIAFLIKFSWKYMFFAWSFPIPHTNILAG